MELPTTETTWWCIELAVQWIVLLTLLGIMTKVQGIKCGFFGVVFSAAVVVLTCQIPLVGSYLCCLVLILCLWKTSRLANARQVIFTSMVVCGALVCLQHWVLKAAMAEIRPRIQAFLPSADGSTNAANNTHGSMTSNKLVATAAAKAIPDIDCRGMLLQGVILHRSHPTAVVRWNNEVHPMQVGEVFSVSTRQGPIQMRCDAIQGARVEMTLANAKKVVLKLP